MSSYDACIVGGGVIGCSVAAELSKRGYKTAILEKGKAGGESSGAAAGLLGVQAEWDEYDPLFDLAKESRRMFPEAAAELRRETGIDIGYEEKGIYKIAETADELNLLEEAAAWQTAAGEPARMMTGRELKEKEPRISGNLAGGVFYPKDGHVIAPALTKAYEQAALVRGTEIYEDTAAEELLISSGKAAGIRTSGGRVIEAERIIIAAGAWSTPFLKHFQRDYETYPVKGEMISVTCRKRLVHAPIYKNGFYIVPKREGRYLIGATVMEHDYSRHVTLNGMMGLMETAARILPSIREASFERAWSGLRPQSSKRDPFMEEHPEIYGLYACTGHYRNGILLSPAAGKWMADLLEKIPAGGS